MKTITITFPDEGGAAVDAAGFAGKGCHAATKPYEDALGAVTSMTEKPEALQPTPRPEVRRG